MPIAMERAQCSCGCGKDISIKDSRGRNRYYVKGHGMRGRTLSLERRRMISNANRGKTGNKNANWKGGKLTGKYIIIWTSEGYRPEHILVVEKTIGRKLKYPEVVHHINGNKHDNRTKNLLVCTESYHRYLHNRMSYLYQQLVFQDNAQTS